MFTDQRRFGTDADAPGPLLAQINHFSSLQELHIYISRSGRPGKDTSAASGYIVPVLAHLRPDALQTVSFRLGNLGSGRRGHFFLELRSKVDELLTKFPRLGSVSFQLPCPVGDLPRDVGMLERLLLDRLPKLRETGVPVTLQWHQYVHTLRRVTILDGVFNLLGLHYPVPNVGKGNQPIVAYSRRLNGDEGP